MLNKELLLTTENGLKGPHRITVGTYTDFLVINWGGSSVLDFGEIVPQEIGGFQIKELRSSNLNITTTAFVSTLAQQFSKITITRLDNQKKFILSYNPEASNYLANGRLFQEEDVGKTIDLLIEAT